MIIVDQALAKFAAEGKRIRVGMVGAGFMGRGVVLQLVHGFEGIDIVAISNRTLPAAYQAWNEAGIEDVTEVSSLTALENAIASGKPAVTEDAMLICTAGNIDVVLDVTGAVEFGAHVAMTCIDNGKHLISMNAEVDGTIGPILKEKADKAGIIITNADGDQPGVTMNLYRMVVGIGLRPVLCGNIKGLQDPYRNPTTQEGFARQWGQKAHMVTSFADGSKISFEQAIIANGTGMRVAKRGMYGFEVERGRHVDTMTGLWPQEELLEGPGIVDYCVGAAPGPGVFVYATTDHPRQRHYLNLYKLGEGPIYSFFRPYHLCHFEVPNSIARAVLFGDATLVPKDKPYVDVITTAKIDLKAGQTLDGIGWYMTYGEAENADVVYKERLLPMGLAEGCVLKNDVPKDRALTYDDVIIPEGRLIDQLRKEQDERFFVNVPQFQG
ncbi:MAG: Gfo/Idh/MocA family oxidoreductase [Bacteroidia bacterium]